MKNYTFTLLLSALTLSACAVATGDSASLSACEISSIKKIAKHFNTEPSQISQTSPYESRNGLTTTCQWDFVKANGTSASVHLRKEERNPKVTNPDFFKSNIDYIIRQGRKIAGQTIKYQAAEIQGLPAGASTEIYGNKYTKSIDYMWQVKEKRRYTLSLSNTQGETAKVKAPSLKDLEDIAPLFDF